MLVLLSLALALSSVGLATARNLVLRPLPYDRPAGLLRLWEHTAAFPGLRQPVSPGTLTFWEANSETVQSFGYYFVGGEGAVVGDDARSDWASSGFMSASLLPVLGLRPTAGRGFRDLEPESVILVSHAFWQRWYGGSAEAVGARILLDGASYQVVGVVPESMDLLGEVEIWRPLAFRDRIGLIERGERYLEVVARAAPEQSEATVAAELNLLAETLARDYPTTNAGWTAVAGPLREALLGAARRAALALNVGGALTLVLVLLNVTQLVTVTTLRRRPEIAMRLALGCTRRRLLIGSMLEHAVLGGVAGAIGLIAARASASVTVAWLGGGPETRYALSPSAAAAAVTVLTAAAAGALLGCAPLLAILGSARRLLVGGDRVQSGRVDIPGRRLVPAQIVLATALLVGALGIGGELRRLLDVPTGFDGEGVVVADVRVPQFRYDRPGVAALAGRLHRAATRMPGVAGAGITTHVPFTPSGRGHPLRREGATEAEGLQVQFSAVGGRFFQTLGVQPLAGDLDALEAASPSSSPVAAVNASLAERLWPAGDVIGQRVVLGYESEPRRVVAVVGNVRMVHPDGAPALHVYVPFAQSPRVFFTLVARGQFGAGWEQLLELTLLGRGSGPVVHSIRPMAAVVDRALLTERRANQVIWLLAALATALAAIGMYGLSALASARRRAEFAVRAALGATAEGLLRERLLDLGRNVLAGVPLGVVMAFALVQLLRAGLGLGVQLDVVTVLAAMVITAATSVGGALIPVWKSSRRSPAEVLRDF